MGQFSIITSVYSVGRRILASFSTNSIMSSCLEKRCIHHTAPRSKDYEAAVQALNSLQSNAAVLQAIRKERDRFAEHNIPQTEKFLKRIGIEVEELNDLNIIHVSGTKGKGSTTSFCESLLRHHGYKTGFYSSPHLVEARERIRINGQPVSQEMFSFYFWKVYSDLWKNRESDEDMPPYFRFLTIMAFYTFLKEKVDVAIIEVGIGGEYDCTNVVRKPVVCGVTSLGLDHVSILGSTLDRIAWNKAGIFKHGTPAFTVCQPPEAMNVLVHRAIEKEILLCEVSPLSEPIDGFSSYIQYINAALAVQLSQAWMDIRKKGTFQPAASCGDSICSSLPLKLPVPALTQKIIKGLSNCFWPGRTQVMRKGSITYFLDGAHTSESIEACVEWFKKASEKEKSRVNGSVFKVLVFNLTGDRKAEDTIAPLVSCHFDFVIFCPNFAHVSVSGSSDQIAVASTWEMQMERCTHNYNAWRQLVSSARSQKDETQTSEDYSRAAVFDSICGILKWLSQNRGSNLQTDSNDKHLCELLVAADQVQVLVTGSLLLVGGFLGLLDPELKGTSDNTDIGLKLAVSGSQHILNGIHANLMSTCCVPGTP